MTASDSSAPLLQLEYAVRRTADIQVKQQRKQSGSAAMICINKRLTLNLISLFCIIFIFCLKPSV